MRPALIRCMSAYTTGGTLNKCSEGAGRNSFGRPTLYGTQVMLWSWTRLLVVFAICFVLSSGEDDYHEGHYTNNWVVRMSGGEETATILATEMGYKNLGELRGFTNTYLMQKLDHPKRSKRAANHITKRLSDDSRVIWAEQQLARRRDKRDYPSSRLRMPPTRNNLRFNDPLWPNQWYLQDTRNMPDLPELDHHVTKVWDMGITGKGVVVSILDDGLEWNHTDIIKNYDPKASWDFNDNDEDPFPRYDDFDSNNHGTRCAGEVSMLANNEMCGVGVAYNSKIGGIRMLDGDVYDAVESTSLAFNLGHVDVFSASWGPSDDGMTVEGPKRLALEALEKGVTEGRNGLGVIYVWASGNGGVKGDNCNCDGYTGSLYTLSVSSASQRGSFPFYGEKCASTMASTYSSGAYSDQKITTSDLRNKCTVSHTGTSASAPLAAGIVALVLEANPKLNWRDVQHLVVWTSNFEPLKNNRGWKRNSAGLMYNSRFGFGLINAEEMVMAAKSWTTVPRKATCTVKTSDSVPTVLASGNSVEFTFTADGCKGTPNEIEYLEHVQINTDIVYSYRGALDIYVISPSGSVSMVLYQRKKDLSSAGFRKWTVMSVHFWGEKPTGTWKVVIRDVASTRNSGTVNSISLVLHGTKEMPEHMKRGPRRYSGESLIRSVLDESPEFEEPAEEPYVNEMKNEIITKKLQKVKDSQDRPLSWADVVGRVFRSQPSTIYDY